MPEAGKAEFNRKHISRIKGFLLGLSGANIFSLLIYNMDKLILVNIVSLKDFGYYTLAATMAAILLKLAYPFIQSVYPRLVQLTHFQRDRK